ncbi:hypothetical protein F4678DRAFT_157126 [Xylaria arbuscula]|nr:hypothetical protein F4678DRAFT_157126 [Xylaria arbuscula]
MAAKPDHLERTAAEPRDKSLHTIILEHIDEVNDTTRVFRLGIPRGSPPIRFLPGQWLDVYLPGIEKAGGFTITSTPRDARLAHPSPPEPKDDGREAEDGESQDSNKNKNMKREGPYLELAVQKSPDNPPAAWLWQNAVNESGSESGGIIGKDIRVRVGGTFVWPPPGINVRTLRRVVFVAGGVGVNPLVSMLCSLASASSAPKTSTTGAGDLEVRFIYSAKDPGVDSSSKGKRGAGNVRNARNVLFLERIARVFRRGLVKGRLELFLTGGADAGTTDTTKDTTEAGTEEGEGQNAETGLKSHEDGDADEVEDGEIIVGAGNTGNGDGDGDVKDDNKNEKDEAKENDEEFTIPFHPRRCTVEDDVATAIGNPRFTVVYVCGVPDMTDEFVAKLTGPQSEGGLGMEPHRVLCEKWW